VRGYPAHSAAIRGPADMRCISKCRGAVSPGQQSQGPRPHGLILPSRIAAASGSLTALYSPESSSGLGGRPCRRGELQSAIGAAAAPARGGCVTRVGRFWMGRAYADPPRGSTLDRISVQAELAGDGGWEINPAGMRSRRVAVSLKDSWRASSPGRRTRPLATNQPMPADGPRHLLGLVHTSAPIGVQSNTSWPCGQDSRP
jgi:hypothetical protein